MQSQVESGAELLMRLNNRSGLRELDDVLFFQGVRNTDVIEISGEQSTGKTLLLSRMLAKCILPCRHGIDGCDAIAILINTDHHFQVSKLLEIMNKITETARTASLASEVIDQDFDKTILIKNALRNLYVINCYNSEQFSLTLHTLDDMLLNNIKTVLLAIDSITAYYWHYRETNGFVTFDSYVKSLLKTIKLHTTRFNVVMVYTRAHEDAHRKERKLSENLFGTDVDYKVHLRKTNDPQTFLCISSYETEQTVKKVYYSISSNGIKWETDVRKE